MKKARKNKRLFLFFYIGFIGAFLLGALSASLIGPIVHIEHLSQIQTKESTLMKADFSDEAFKALLDMMHDEATYFTPILNAYYDEVIHYYFTDCDCDDFTKGFIGLTEDLKKHRLSVIHDPFVGFVAVPDVDYFLSTYSSNLTQEARDYLGFRSLEHQEHLFLEDHYTIDMTQVVERLDWLSHRLDTPVYGPIYKELYDFYLAVFKGENHDFYVNFDTQSLTDYARIHYGYFSDREDVIGEIATQILIMGPWQQSIFE